MQKMINGTGIHRRVVPRCHLHRYIAWLRASQPFLESKRDSLLGSDVIQNPYWSRRPAWMVRAYSDDLRERVVAAMRSGESCRSIAVRFGVAPSSVVKWTARARRTGSVSPAKMGGYRRPILDPHRNWLLEQVRGCPHVTLAGLRDLLAARGVTVSHDTVWRFLRGCGFSFKKRRWSPTNASART